MVASYSPHFGEEPELVGDHGSGTIFFSHCNLLCNFCQNDDISHGGHGHPVSDEDLAAMMIRLQDLGCHNINFVTPTHVIAQIVRALLPAVRQGLRIPLVYNSSGYDRTDTIRRIEGIFDIYMPDFKFWDRDIAGAACNAPDYPETAAAAIREMHRQVGELQTSARGVARRGLIIRHLVMPDNLAGTESVARFIAAELSPDTYVNIMPQYRPCYRAGDIPELNRRIRPSEFYEAVETARSVGLKRLSRL